MLTAEMEIVCPSNKSRQSSPHRQQIGGLAFGQRAEILVDAQGFRSALGKSLNDLHRRQARLDHQLHLPMFEKSLDEEGGRRRHAISVAIGRSERDKINFCSAPKLFLQN